MLMLCILINCCYYYYFIFQINIKRDYEALLRSEVSKWQAPEIYNSEVSTATDVYGLTLLILEMCGLMSKHEPPVVDTSTSNIDYDEKYTKWKCGIITNMSNFPSLLTSLVEAGLQLHVTKRTINIPRIRKFLQRLEIQYEDKRPIHISTLITNYNNNNNDDNNNIDSTMSNCSTLLRSKTRNKKLKPYSASTSITSIPFDNKTSTSYTPLTSLSSIPNRRYSEDYLTTHICNSLDGNKVISMDSLASDDYENIQDNECLMEENKSSTIDKVQELELVIKKSIINADGIESNENYTDPRLGMKKIKESIADKRKKFFSNNYNSLDNQSIVSNVSGYSVSEIISPMKNKDLPHNSTSILLKNKSLTLDNENNNKSVYSSVPSPIKNAVVPPRVINNDAEDFFETSPWRKERLICMSKMSKSKSLFDTNSSKQINSSALSSSSSASDKTFPVVASSEKYDFKKSEDCLGDRRMQDESTRRIMTKSTSLQTFHKIKNALDRAREILTTDSSMINLKNEKSMEDDVEEVGNTEKLNSSGDTYTIGTPEPKTKKIVDAREEAMKEHHQCLCLVENKNKYNVQVQTGQDEKQNVTMKDEKSGKNFAFFVFNDNEIKEKCLSCSQTSIPRRSSLPARLGSIKNVNYSMDSKLPTELTHIHDNTFQDIYIDDGFDENLAVNMLLVDDDHSFDDKELDEIFFNTDVSL